MRAAARSVGGARLVAGVDRRPSGGADHRRAGGTRRGHDRRDDTRPLVPQHVRQPRPADAPAASPRGCPGCAGLGPERRGAGRLARPDGRLGALEALGLRLPRPWPPGGLVRAPAVSRRAGRHGRAATALSSPHAAFRSQQLGMVQDDLALGGFWAWFNNQSPAAQAAAIASPLNKLRQFLLRPALLRMLDQRESRFRLRDLFRSNKIVLVPLNEGLIGPGTASLLGSLVIADLWQATQERASDYGVGQRPGVVYVDEAPRFLNLPVSLADALAVSRSLGVGWFLAAQFRSQFPPALQAAGERTLPLIPQVRDELEALGFARMEQDEHGVLVGGDGASMDDCFAALARNNEELVFLSTTGTPLDPKNVVRAFQMVSKEAGVPRITVHHTRHTAATLLNKLRVPARDAQLILGHAHVTTTQQLYQHGDTEGQLAALMQVGQLLTGGVAVKTAVNAGLSTGEGANIRALTPGGPRETRTLDTLLKRQVL